MPKDFNTCVAEGGRVVTKMLKGGKYMHLCYPKGGGPAVAGEVRTKEKMPKKPMMKDMK